MVNVPEEPPLIPDEYYRLIRDQASGELPLADFKALLAYSGFVPSAGAEGIAQYLATKAQSFGLSHVSIERFDSGESYCWAFRNEPYWEGIKGELWLVGPDTERLADFKAVSAYLARNSRSASVTAALIDVGSGASPQDYDERSVAGKLVLASGPPSLVMRLAVWERGAAGVVAYRTLDAVDFPDQIGIAQLVPWIGPNGEVPTFAFSLSYRAGRALAARLASGEALTLRAEVEAAIGAGQYPEVRAEIPGSDASLPAVVIYAHYNSRNTGGANNLTGVGCTLEVARLLSHLIGTGAMPQPRRAIRFMWGAEHYGFQHHIHAHPDDLENILAMINIDMIGYNQQTAGAVLHLYRSPHSNPSFVDDIVEAFLEKIGRENTISIRHANYLSARPSAGFLDPIFAPTGSRAQLRYNVESFWGPSVHEGAQSLGVRAIMLGDFPDVFLSTQDDGPQAVDATQMRRGVVLTASAGYCMASASSSDTHRFLLNAATKAQKRLLDDQVRACAYIEAADEQGFDTACGDARNIIARAISREVAGIETLSSIVGPQSLADQVTSFMSGLRAVHEMSQSRLEAHARARAAQLGLREKQVASSGETADAGIVPARTNAIRAPVNFSRLEYGRWWLIEKTGDEHFDKQLRLPQHGEYMAYEALNFADGKKTMAQIRDALSAEFGPVPLGDVVQYFQFMEELGVVTLKATSSSPAAGFRDIA